MGRQVCCKHSVVLALHEANLVPGVVVHDFMVASTSVITGPVLLNTLSGDQSQLAAPTGQSAQTGILA